MRYFSLKCNYILLKNSAHLVEKWLCMCVYPILSIYGNNSHVGRFVGSSILKSDTKVSKERIHIKKIIVSKIA